MINLDELQKNLDSQMELSEDDILIRSLLEMCAFLPKIIDNSNTVNLIENNDGRKRVKTLLVSDFISSILSSSELKILSDIPVFSPIYQEKDNMKLIQTIQLNKTTKIYIILR
ncbi:hypothetical protein IC216_14425 [Clostridioides sp. ES-S-0145-01]|uniref:hypothetical protein n=1 Tax=Clostridioides sp. ES-S-0145-01 TaxID=2770784 RepID=UPI001D12D10A|nr:hypothetical protein [Clostridioides sp. ES-S-0145-01]